MNSENSWEWHKKSPEEQLSQPNLNLFEDRFVEYDPSNIPDKDLRFTDEDEEKIEESLKSAGSAAIKRNTIIIKAKLLNSPDDAPPLRIYSITGRRPNSTGGVIYDDDFKRAGNRRTG